MQKTTLDALRSAAVLVRTAIRNMDLDDVGGALECFMSARETIQDLAIRNHDRYIASLAEKVEEYKDCIGGAERVADAKPTGTVEEKILKDTLGETDFVDNESKKRSRMRPDGLKKKVN